MRYFVLLVAGVLAGCSSPPLDVHQQNLALWTQQRIEHYQYQVEVVCFCPIDFRRPKTVTVQGGEVVAAHFSDTGEALPDALIEQQKTLPQWLADINQMRADDPAELVVEYDTQYGFPRLIRSDYRLDIADDERVVRISNFVVQSP